ncbi:dehydrogenase [Nonomuraea phyllanthi]|uniref:Dihydrolipoamide acetyltransferase component of pyruvate dehydrogenase complex n=1 Tax=Nonomuraea phyllanthi TaxID=2219224 RepID=A0A5C4WLG2_9ACTN|nr:2-oxo acid dehydrogenase subunit E2 [Nonomuraea phyllanthi]KAB8194428.1 dehydrogenase [Nonomuraea phyllanthi]
MAEIRVPKLNTNDEAYVLLEWLVADGAAVRADEVVASVETSKTVEELVSAYEGVLTHLLPAGSDCAPGQPIARIAETPPPGFPPVAAPAPRESLPAPVEGVPAPVGDMPAPAPSAPARAPLITEPAQALIDELGIDPARVLALPVKVVRRADVERLVASDAQLPRQPAPTTDIAGRAGTGGPAEAVGPGEPSGPTEDRGGSSGPGETDDLGGAVRGSSARALSANQRAVGRTVSLSHRTIPAAYAAIKVDVGSATKAARDLTKRLRTLVGLPDLLVAAVARLHPDFPLCFATLVGEGTAAVPGSPHVGVTIDLGSGLYVPVVRDAHRKSVPEIAKELAGFRRLAQHGGFRQEQLDGGNIVVTLHHDPDIVMAVPIVFPGQACAVALTSPQREGERTVAVVGLAYDHRLVNGRDAVLFLQALKEALETPEP